jgi:lysophospholipase L1-like esterase
MGDEVGVAARPAPNRSTNDSYGTTGAQPTKLHTMLRTTLPTTLVLLIAVVGGALVVASIGAALWGGATAASARAPRGYYVSLGDSYAVGYQPGLGATPGYSGYVATHTNLTLVNFGCAGATTRSILTTVGCPVVLPHTAGGVTHPSTTQAAAAESFLRAQRGRVKLITVSIGGNDVTECATLANATGCVTDAAATIEANVTTLAQDLRAAAGPTVPIVGLTYPDSILGAYVYPTNPPSSTAVALANESVTAFQTLVNPSLSRAYSSASGSFVDVTAASGAYGSMSRTVHTAAYGTIPVPVAQVCALTWFCAKGDIHATTKGYRFIGTLVAARAHQLST